jgi:hypothetical protein
MGLVVDTVQLNAKTVSLDHDPFSIQLEEPGSIEVTLSQENLEDFLNKEKPGGLHSFKVSMENDRVNVEATMKVLVEMRGKAICTLRVVNGSQIWIDLQDVEVLGIGARGLVEKQLEKINPVLDVSTFPLELTINEVAIYDGEVVLRGRAAPRK